MKKLSSLLLVASVATFTIFNSSCNQKATPVVGSDFKLGAPIKNFTTFGWSKDIDQIPTDQVIIGNRGVLIFNNESTRSQIKDAIRYELTAKGFTLDNANPDMVVNYNIFEDNATLRTYNGYTTIENGTDTVRTENDVKMVNVKPGTLFISILGGHNEGVVWQGYASGILSAKSIKSNDKIRAAVSAIMNKFDYKAYKK